MKTKLEQFREYHRLNPGLYTFFVQCAREAMDAGYTRFGFPYIYNQARWEYGVKKRNTDFELNNDLAPYYSRYIMMQEPDLFLFFEVRASAADAETGWTAFKARKEGYPSLEAAEPATVMPVDAEIPYDAVL